MTPTRELELKTGGILTYRLPNCLEQLRFYVDSKWNSKELLLEQIEGAAGHLSKFIVDMSSTSYTDFDEFMADRDNVTDLITFAMDIGNQSLDEAKKKS